MPFAWSIWIPWRPCRSSLNWAMPCARGAIPWARIRARLRSPYRCFAPRSAATRGRLAGCYPEPSGRPLPAATLTITLELAARFAADALREDYFGWDAARFGSASEHNEVRAAGQLRLAEDILAQEEELRHAAAGLASSGNRPVDR